MVILKLKNINIIVIKILFLNDVHIDNILISNKIPNDERKYKYFIGYLDYYKIKSFSIILPKTSAYAKSYDGGIKWMYFLIEDEELLKKYNDIWNKVSNSMKK